MRVLFATALLLAVAVNLPGAARADCQMTDFLDVPVKLEGTAAIVEVRINGHPARLALDSGSFSNLLNQGPARALELDVDPDPRWVTGSVNGDVRMALGVAKSFEMATVKVKDVKFLVGGSELESDVQGLLGQDLLGASDVDFDYAARVIHFIRPKDCGAQSLAYWAKPGEFFGMVEVRSSDPSARDLTGVAEVNGVKVRVLFDTGGGDSTLSLAAARRAGISPETPGAVQVTDLAGLGQKKVRSWIVPVKSFEIGGEQILNTRLRIADWTGADRNSVEMILGGDFFISHHVYVANSQHRIYFTYNGGPVFDLTTKPDVAGTK